MLAVYSILEEHEEIWWEEKWLEVNPKVVYTEGELEQQEQHSPLLFPVTFICPKCKFDTRSNARILKTIPCRRLQKRGVCDRGDRCLMMHTQIVCRDYARGKCDRGDKCKYDHILDVPIDPKLFKKMVVRQPLGFYPIDSTHSWTPPKLTVYFEPYKSYETLHDVFTSYEELVEFKYVNIPSFQ